MRQINRVQKNTFLCESGFIVNNLTTVMVLLILAYKVGQSFSESFSLWLKSPKKGANNYFEHYPPKEKMLRIVVGTFFGRFEQK